MRNDASQLSGASRTDSEQTSGTPGADEVPPPPPPPPALVTSPLDMNVRDHSRQSSTFDHPLAPAGPRQLSTYQPSSVPSPYSSLITAGPTSPGVRDRARMYERRLSQEVPKSPPRLTNTKKYEERVGPRPVVRYGLVPKPALFVANPDGRNGSTDTLAGGGK